ncbi:hypothetical protein JMJ58_17895 [Haloterrigena salifodinae]|uniref:Uncharacterized protein n=1 Tax=Haloterrigena salifodinae TaxID=2675099 RepID=A0A8T8E008_9EURY|nr:hypothetical protein [Haloterrigena salifodinae]QRV14770.1 hypothetical protein JMJ58_17895 [Haloterrigena salifodinae]
MDASTLRAIHRYGAIVSLVATAAGAIGFAVNGSNSALGLFFGFLGPLCGFYFGGAVLYEKPRYHILGEELLRGVAWYFGSLVGWSVVITSSAAVPVTPATAFGLPVLTALGLTVAMVAIRRRTGLDLKVETRDGQLLIAILGGVVGGFLALYLVLAAGYSPWLLALYAIGTIAGAAFWDRRWRRRGVTS